MCVSCFVTYWLQLQSINRSSQTLGYLLVSSSSNAKYAMCMYQPVLLCKMKLCMIKIYTKHTSKTLWLK